MVIGCLLLGSLHAPLPAAAAPVTNLGTATPAVSTDYGLKDGSLAWGDYDNDGDLDLLITGNNLAGGSETSIITNHEGSMVKDSLGLQAVQLSSGAWGDYDNDGYLDILLTGVKQMGGTKETFTGVYHNVSASGPAPITREFTLLQELDPVYNGEGVWGDYDQDGFLDILLTGNTAADAPFSRIYRFNGSTFVNSGVTITALTDSSAAWADFNLDGYIDFAISGKTVAGTPVTQVYRNNQNANFTSANLPAGLHSGTLTWIDTSNDGFLELLVTGNSSASGGGDVPQTLLYRYSGNSAPYFNLVTSTGLDDYWSSSVSSGDYNNDGLADLAIFGLMDGDQVTRIYTSNGDDTFTLDPFELPDPYASGLSLAWGDHDQNGTLDLAVSGIYEAVGEPPVEHYYLNIYMNDTPPPPANAAPGAPSLQAACWDGSSRLTLHWNAAGDDRTAANALSYNLRMGTTPDGINRVSPGYLPGLGAVQPVLGNTYNGTQAILGSLSPGDYYWSVQAVDASYAGGTFADSTNTVINYGEAVAQPDSFTIDEDSTGTILDILGNDNGGANNEPLRRYGYSPPTSGTLSETGTGELMYTPRANFYGNVSFNYYAIRENSKYCSLGRVTIHIQQVNDAPTDISLTNYTIAAGVPIGTEIGYFSTTDNDSSQSYTYEFVPDGNALDNEFFSLFRDATNYTPPRTFLRTNAAMPPVADDFSYDIQIRTTDNGSPALSYTEVMTITVVPGNQATSITLSDYEILEHQGTNEVVGRLRTYMNTTEDRYATYTLVADSSGNTHDNNFFNIYRNSSTNYDLRATGNLDFDELAPANNVYEVYVRSSNLALRPDFEQLLQISVLVTEPAVTALDDNGVTQNDTVTVTSSEDTNKVVTLRATEAGDNETIHWEVISGPSYGGAVLAAGDTTNGQSKTVTYTPATNWFGSDSFVVQVNDPDFHTDQITVNINVQNVNDPPTLNPIGNVTYPELSGPHTIHLTGVTAGPPNEGGINPPTRLTITVVRPWYANDPWPFFNYTTSEVVDGEADVILSVGMGPGFYPVKIVVSDGFQQVSQDVQIEVVPAPKQQLRLPFITK